MYVNYNIYTVPCNRQEECIFHHSHRLCDLFSPLTISFSLRSLAQFSISAMMMNIYLHVNTFLCLAISPVFLQVYILSILKRDKDIYKHTLQVSYAFHRRVAIKSTICYEICCWSYKFCFFFYFVKKCAYSVICNETNIKIKLNQAIYFI